MIVLVSMIVLLRGFPCFHDFLHGDYGRVTHDCASVLDSIAKGISLFPRFFAWCIPTFIIFIQMNDFCTCSTYFFHLLLMVRVNAATRMRTCTCVG